MDSIHLKSCATVANLSCGFDVLGLSIHEPYDEITISKSNDKFIKLEILESAYDNIPSEVKKNTGGVPAELILNDFELDFGFDIKIKKGIPLCGGLGSSAATAVGVVFGINQLLNQKLDIKQMLSYALEGEKVSVTNAHADNIAPCLLGGLTLIKDTDSLEIVKIPISDFYVVAIHPDIKISTQDARDILPDKISLKSAIKQWGNLSSLVYAFSNNNLDLIKSSMHDCIVEPLRKTLITGFDEIKKNALDMGALGCGISGSGPTIFALCQTIKIAEDIGKYSTDYYDSINLDSDIYISSINNAGPQII